MSLKSKLAGLERRLGVTLCPHCKGTLTARHEAQVYAHEFNDEEQLELLQNIFTRFYDREKLLKLLACLNPSVRQAVGDVYPLSADEQLAVDHGGWPFTNRSEERQT